jgi:hypothetical protein
MMGAMKRPLILASVLLLLGCSAPAPATVAPPAASVPAATTPAPTPTPTTATPEQLASIITGHQDDWREVIDGAFDCRFLWVTGGEDAADDALATACYAREFTAVLTTGTAAKDLRALTPPDSMEQLVADTLEVLDSIHVVDLEGACGDAFDGPKGSKRCTAAIGDLSMAYRQLDGVLDQWEPYT